MKLEIDINAFDGIFKEILKYDYNLIVENLKELNDKDELSKAQKSDRENYMHYKKGYEIVMDYVLTREEKNEVIIPDENKCLDEGVDNMSCSNSFCSTNTETVKKEAVFYYNYCIYNTEEKFNNMKKTVEEKFKDWNILFVESTENKFQPI